MKTVLVDIYTRYTTRLLNEDRTEKRPWEGADRMTELQFESLIACAEGEHIAKRMPKPSFPPKALRENGNARAVEPSMIQRSEDAGYMTESVGRRPSIFASDIKYDEASERSENHQRRPCLFTPNFTFSQPQKNAAADSGSLAFAPDSVHEQAELQISPNPHDLEPLEETESIATPAQRRPSLLPALVTMGTPSKRLERAERGLLTANAEALPKEGHLEEQPQVSKKVPVARLKRPWLLHRSTAPDRVAGMLELVGQGNL